MSSEYIEQTHEDEEVKSNDYDTHEDVSDGKKPSLQKLRSYDSLDLESAKVPSLHGHGTQV